MSINKSVYLPEGVIQREEENKNTKKPARGTIRYPDKEFYSDFYAICEKARVSMNDVLVGFARDFIKRNRFLLKTPK